MKTTNQAADSPPTAALHTAAAHTAALEAAYRNTIDPYLQARAAAWRQLVDKKIDRVTFQAAQQELLAQAAVQLRDAMDTAVPDPWERAQVIASQIVPAKQRVDEYRPRRDIAALVLVEDKGWQPRDVYRLIGVTRGLLVRMRSRGPAELPHIADPEVEAVRAAEIVATNDLLVEVWRPVRDHTIAVLFETRPDLSDAEIGRLFQVTGQRITIMRTQGR